jgi:hypothetical protein
LNEISPHPSTSESEPRAAIARVIRRICLLRERGDEAGAQRLHNLELGNAVRDFRLAYGPAALTESELRALHAREEQRIADAVVLAEILIPQLTMRRAPSGTCIAPTTPDSNAPPPAPPPPPPPVSPRPPASGSPGIPDLLDAMFAAERAQRRAPATSRH